MPGRPDIFIPNFKSNPPLSSPIEENRITREFKLSNIKKSNNPFGSKYISNCLSVFTYEEYLPNDDESLNIAIKASYRQIYGNFHPMESERPIDLERRLRNGDLNIKEFIRCLAKSEFYVSHYFQKVSQQRAIELNIKHLLGRPPECQNEIINCVQILHEQGFNNHIDLIINSDEYNDIFGDHIVPYMRCWNSPCGIRTSSFRKSSKLTQSFATSDNVLHRKKINGKLVHGNSILIKDCAKHIY